MVDGTEDFAETIRREREESIADVYQLLSAGECNIYELKEREEPSVLVLGTGEYFPEAHIMKRWAEENQKRVTVHCVEQNDIDEFFIARFLELEESEYFHMEFHNAKFERYAFDEKFDLILLLRFSNLSMVADDVYQEIPQALNDEGVFVMSGGYTHQFRGYGLKQPGIDLEVNRSAPFSFTDHYKVYSGKNMIFKFRKHQSED